jgi:hypothetical protein
MRGGANGHKEARSTGRARKETLIFLSALMYDSVNAPSIRVIAVIAELVTDEEHDQDKDGHARGQTEDIERGIKLAFLDVPPGDDEVVPEHDATPEDVIFDEIRNRAKNLNPIPNPGRRPAPPPNFGPETLLEIPRDLDTLLVWKEPPEKARPKLGRDRVRAVPARSHLVRAPSGAAVHRLS